MKKYLDFYQKYAKKGVLPTNGLCASFRDDELFRLIDPDEGERISYWGYDGIIRDGLETVSPPYHDEHYGFTSLRQTVVLLMAAMNGEL